MQKKTRWGPRYDTVFKTHRGVGVGPGVGLVFSFVLASFLAAKSGVTATRFMQGLLLGTRPRRLCNVAYYLGTLQGMQSLENELFAERTGLKWVSPT